MKLIINALEAFLIKALLIKALLVNTNTNKLAILLETYKLVDINKYN
jgi:hypothetical protein